MRPNGIAGNEWRSWIIGAGKLFQKEEIDDTGIGLKTVRKGKIGLKRLSRRIWLISSKILANTLS